MLSGKGKSFRAGLDMSSFAEMNAGDLSAESEDVVRAIQDIIPAGSNIRLVHSAAKLGFVEINWGLLPDMSASQSLRTLGADRPSF